MFKILFNEETIHDRETRVSEELRGWAWKSPPVEPLVDGMGLGVWGVVAGYCETRRDVYLHRVLKLRPEPSHAMLWGRAVHKLLLGVIRHVKELVIKMPQSGSELYEELKTLGRNYLDKLANENYTQWCDYSKLHKLYSHIALTAASEYDSLVISAPSHARESIVNRFLEISAERIVDGSRLGLSKWLMIDVYKPPNMIAEIKVGKKRSFHELSLAGYAMALESSTGTPINMGHMIYVHVNDSLYIRHERTTIGDELRRSFLEERDRVMQIIYHERDPGKPQSCPETCPFYSYCWGEGA